MDFKSLINSLDTISENTTVHKGTYGTSHGKEDVRDQYGHKVGKINKDADGKKDAPKKGRGRPKKGADASGEVKSYDSSALGSVFGGGKKPSKEIGKKSVKHSLKEYIEEAEYAINEDMNSQDPIQVKPASQTNTQVIQQGDKTIGTVSNPQLANQIKQSISKGEMTLAGDEQKMSEDDEMNQDRAHGGHDPAEYDMEGDFVKTQLHTIARSTRDLEERLSDQEDLPEWVQMKISQAQGMLASVSDYIDSESERDTERGTGEEVMVSEKAKSKAQQRFFGMVSAMQKGKKVPGASKELKGVAKDIGKKDATDFAKTKHKGLPDHVSETGCEDQGVSEESKGLWANIHAKRERIKNGSGEHMRKPGTKGAPTASTLKKSATEDVAEGEQRMSRAAKGHEKYGKQGMQALAKAGREGASEKKLDTIRSEYDRYDKEVSEAKDLPGKQDNLDVAPPKGKLTKADFEALRAKKKVKESTNMNMKQLTEGAMKDLLINFYSDVEAHKGDGSVFDLKKAKNVQQAEEILKALVKHGDEYDGLDNSSQNELVNQTLKYLAHEKELPFNTLANVDKQRFATRTPADLSKFRQNPATPGTNSFSKSGTSMASPRTSSTGSNGFLKTLGTTPTFNESNDMKDKQFESWENTLNSLLTEGITVSHSTGQQGSPDSLSINATENDATELMSILRNSGMEMFGGKQQEVSYGGSEQGSEEGGEEFHQGTEIAPSPEVVGDGSDMLELIKKMSGIGTDAGTPGSVEVDYEPEGGEEQDSDEEHSYDDEESDEEDSSEDQDSDKEEVDEAEVEEGNFFTGNLAKARAQGKDEADLDGDGEMEKVQEGDEMCNECGGAMYEGHTCDDEQVEEGYANEAGHEELAQLKTLLSMGNDLHREKRTQATGNIQKVTMETKLLKNSTELLTDWKKLSGIK